MGIGSIRTSQECALVRAAAEDILDEADGQESWQRNYRQMARGTLAALDWLEGRRATTPSTGEVRRPDEIIERSYGGRPSALVLERTTTEDWGSGHVRPPSEDMHYHGAVWSLLCWWQRPSHTTIAISVPGLPGPLDR